MSVRRVKVPRISDPTNIIDLGFEDCGLQSDGRFLSVFRVEGMSIKSFCPGNPVPSAQDRFNNDIKNLKSCDIDISKLDEALDEASAARSRRYTEMELRYDGPIPDSARHYIETGEWP